jgi:hypothetical protein
MLLSNTTHKSERTMQIDDVTILVSCNKNRCTISNLIFPLTSGSIASRDSRAAVNISTKDYKNKSPIPVVLITNYDESRTMAYSVRCVCVCCVCVCVCAVCVCGPGHQFCCVI